MFALFFHCELGFSTYHTDNNIHRITPTLDTCISDVSFELVNNVGTMCAQDKINFIHAPIHIKAL